MLPHYWVLKEAKGVQDTQPAKQESLVNSQLTILLHILILSGLTRALAVELGKANIRVNVIVPGYIETDMTEGM